MKEMTLWNIPKSKVLKSKNKGMGCQWGGYNKVEPENEVPPYL